MQYEDTRKQEMYDWFHANFMAPEMCDPRMSKEHGYQYICGGPYFADEVVQNAFAEKYPAKLVKEVIKDL